MKKWLAILLAVLMVLPSFAMAEPTQKAVYDQKLEDIYGRLVEAFKGTEDEWMIEPYAEPVVITSANHYSATDDVSMSKWGDLYGEDWYKNRWTDFLKKAFNIDLQYMWWAADTDYDQKLRLEMTADNLPDVFNVTNQNDLVQLARAGMLMDLTDMFDKYAWSRDKEIWASDGGVSLDLATIDGRIYGLPAGLPHTDEVSYLWLRKDWLDKLGLENPKTIEDLVAIIKAFKAADFDGDGIDNTVGMGIDKTLWYSTRGLFNAHAAYPMYWIEKDGGLLWGGIDDANKPVLELLATLYKEGLLNNEFITEANGDMLEYMINGQCGVVYGGHWLGHIAGDNHELQPEGDWTCVTLPTATGEPVRSPMKALTSGWTVVSAKCKNPEAAFKVRLMTTFALNDIEATWWYLEDNTSWHFSPVRSNVSALANYESWLECLDMYKNGDPSVLGGLGLIYWESLQSELKYEWELMFGPEDDAAMAILGQSINDGLLFYDAFMGAQSDYMLDRWSTIQSEQLIAYTSMILGEVSVDEGFEAWKATFNALGGEKITAEVNEWYASTK